MPAVVFFHGYTGCGPQFADCLTYAGQGYVVASMDCRGQGGKSYDLNPVMGNTFRGHIIRGLDDVPENMYLRNVFLDTSMVARIVMGLDYVDESRVCACGGSQGGALTLACAALTPTLKLAVCNYPFLCDYKRVWEMDIPTSPYIEIRDYFRAFDPNHKREEEIFTKLGYIDIQHLAKRIRAEVFMQTGLMDNVCPPSTQFAAYNKISSKKDVLIYPDYGHEGLKDAADVIALKIFEAL
jgi:cephalosporin-C deacetylase